MDVEWVCFDEPYSGIILKHAVAASLGGSRVNKRNKENQRLAQTCEAAFTVWFTEGHFEIYDQRRQYYNQHLYEDDGGYDLPREYGVPVDVKARAWSSVKAAERYALLVHPHEYRKGWVYVLAGTTDSLAGYRAGLVGWCYAEELVLGRIRNKKLRHLYAREAVDCHPMIHFPYHWNNGKPIKL